MENIIECNNLTHYYGKRLIYENLSFSVPKGRILGLLGKNGTGKTTTINILSGYLKPRSGQCSIFGQEIQAMHPSTRRNIGLLIEGHVQYQFMTIREIEKFYSAFYPGQWRKEAYYDLMDKLKVAPGQRISRMSCGQRSQVALGLILAQNPELLVLDDFSLGLDPGYRMGCKVAVVDPTGKVLDTNVVYPVPEFKRVDQAKKTIKSMVLKNEVEVMAIGNGTAGHETEEFAAAVIRELAEEKGLHLQYMVVSEAGASVYSASKLAAEEFPQYDVNLRSAVSIARRLQDPLAELVKIDPKAVGVGQYQHDMPQKRLNETLDGVVEDCVNSVGVDLNTASAPLLARVAGITNATAKNIVAWREEEGAFTSRAQLKKVKGLGPKAFEQCAGFLRLPGAKNPLDATAVHPESYPAAKGLLEACGCDAKEIGTDAMQSLPVRVKNCGTKALCEALGVGEPTLMDIVSELCKPGRDVRDSLPKPLLRSDVMGLEDLKPGMELKGTVRNVIDFGAFVDIGVHQDGLVHVSQISDKFIKNPRDALKVGDVVQVKVLSVDTAKKRIALTMKGVPQS